MMLNMLKGKIHRATVVQAEVDYVGSITIDEDLMDAAGILEYEKVQVADVNNGSRLETYVIAGERGSGMICLNGAAARFVSVGDKVIIMCYAQTRPAASSPTWSLSTRTTTSLASRATRSTASWRTWRRTRVLLTNRPPARSRAKAGTSRGWRARLAVSSRRFRAKF